VPFDNGTNSNPGICDPYRWFYGFIVPGLHILPRS
jgi:hypothetical protein